MPAQGTRRKPTKTRRPQAKPKMVRLHVAPKLTQGEIRQLKAKAAADMRSIGNYVAFLVIQDLRDRRLTPSQRGRVPSPGDRRVSYEIAAPL